MQVQGSFDASTVQPQQGATVPPPGHYPFMISNTSIVPMNSGNGGRFVVEFTTPAGVISNGYNLWFKEPHTESQKISIDIANKQLSALCHATGIFKLDWQNEGAALRGARGTLEVGKQKDTDYMEVKKVFDANGNEPGKPPKQNAETQMQAQTQQGNGGWGATGGQTQNGPSPQPQGWGTANPNPQPNPAPQPNAGWTQAPPSNGTANPPWAGPGK